MLATIGYLVYEVLKNLGIETHSESQVENDMPDQVTNIRNNLKFA